MNYSGIVFGNSSIGYYLSFRGTLLFAHLSELPTVLATSESIEGQEYKSRRLSNMRVWSCFHGMSLLCSSHNKRGMSMAGTSLWRTYFLFELCRRRIQ